MARRDDSRERRIAQILEKRRARLAAGRELPDSAILEQFPDLMPELGAALK